MGISYKRVPRYDDVIYTDYSTPYIRRRNHLTGITHAVNEIENNVDAMRAQRKTQERRQLKALEDMESAEMKSKGRDRQLQALFDARIEGIYRPNHATTVTREIIPYQPAAGRPARALSMPPPPRATVSYYGTAARNPVMRRTTSSRPRPITHRLGLYDNLVGETGNPNYKTSYYDSTGSGMSSSYYGQASLPPQGVKSPPSFYSPPSRKKHFGYGGIKSNPDLYKKIHHIIDETDARDDYKGHPQEFSSLRGQLRGINDRALKQRHMIDRYLDTNYFMRNNEVDADVQQKFDEVAYRIPALSEEYKGYFRNRYLPSSNYGVAYNKPKENEYQKSLNAMRTPGQNYRQQIRNLIHRTRRTQTPAW